MIRTMIIEDEIASQNLLKTIIEDYCPKLELIGIASTVPESQLLIDKLKPELVFLDINLKGRNAFELLEIIKGRKFKIIFTTASQEYAMQAFKVEAIDYILKPYNPKDIIRATSRIKSQHFNPEILSSLRDVFFQDKKKDANKKIVVKTNKGMSFIPINTIIRLEADGSYCRIFFE